MSAKYEPWSGIDNGHEAQWCGPIWRKIFDVLARHDGASYKDPDSPIYPDLERSVPGTRWLTPDPDNPQEIRPFFRDGREPWQSTKVVDFNKAKGTFSITPLGKELAADRISSSNVFMRAMSLYAEDGCNPFAVLAAAFLDPAASEGLTKQQLYGGVMCNFRPGNDDLATALAHAGSVTVVPVSMRRLRNLVYLLEQAGAIAPNGKDEEWIKWEDEKLIRLAGHRVSNRALSAMVSAFCEDCATAGLIVDRTIGLRLSASLAAKPFLIATGLAGSGKTKLAQAFARWLTPNSGHPATSFELVPVGADWTGTENVLGYPSALDAKDYWSKPTLELIMRAIDNPMAPHFLILDEMNLSHVERYFADILSAIESGEEIPLHDHGPREANGRTIPPRVALPRNLFIIGTVNVDETTYMFSPKVLDRANVIEFRMTADELMSFADNPRAPNLGSLDGQGSSYGDAFVASAMAPVAVPSEVKQAWSKELEIFFNVLQTQGAEFGFRTAHETARFCHFFKVFDDSDRDTDVWFSAAFDSIVCQKLLPKLHGSRAKLGPLLKSLWYLCKNAQSSRGEDPIVGALEAAGSSDRSSEPSDDPEILGSAYYPLSANKIARMWRLLRDNGFASFAEA